MKKIFLILLALITLQVSAQKNKQEFRKGNKTEKGQRMSDYTPEEMAQLQTKKMTLDLDLNASQQKQIEKINLENAKERQAKREARHAEMKNGNTQKLSKEERLARINERLDRQLEMKQKMKKILNTEQFEKWEKNQARRQGKSNKRSKERNTRRS